jgi:broad specificity phosphatase PhoE
LPSLSRDSSPRSSIDQGGKIDAEENDGAQAGELYAKLIAERKERRAALVRNAALVDEGERFLEFKERVYATLSESFDLADVEECPNKSGALIQHGTSLSNTYVKMSGLCNQGDRGGSPSAAQS